MFFLGLVHVGNGLQGTTFLCLKTIKDTQNRSGIFMVYHTCFKLSFFVQKFNFTEKHSRNLINFEPNLTESSNQKFQKVKKFEFFKINFSDKNRLLE